MNILFKNIEIHNFLSLGDVSLDLNECGFVLVKGHNEEGSIIQSNGSGKSALFDAIFWAITGETLRGSDSVINEKSNDGCYCICTFESEGVEYKILRSKETKQYGNAVYFYEDGNLLSDQTKKSQELILKTIPSTSSDILGSIILLGQGLPYRFSALSPMKRKDLLEVMSGSQSQVDKVKYQIDQEEAEYNRQLIEKQQENQMFLGKISGFETSRDMLLKQKDELSDTESLKTSIKEKESLIVEKQTLLDNTNDYISRLMEYIEKYTTFKRSLSETYTTKNTEVYALQTKISQIKEGNCPTCGRPYEITEELLKEKDNNTKELESLSEQLNILKRKLEETETLISNTNDELNNCNSSVTQLTYQISSLKKEIENINSLLAQAESLADQIENMDREIKSSKISVNDNEKEINIVQEYLDCTRYLKRQLSRDFKGYMLEEVIRFLSTRSQYYSEFLFSNSKKIEVSLSGNKILITCGNRPYENLSGGERQRADLAVQFALRDMLVVTSGFACNLLVLDEAFDNLDAQGSESLMKLVTNEFSDIDSVFIVTHHSDISVPYDNTINVIKDKDGISKVEVF